MRTIQQTFDAVIAAGYYTVAQNYMYCAIAAAAGDGVITSREAVKATDSINNYLGFLGVYRTLRNALKSNKLPYSFEVRLAIYKNWRKRPKKRLVYERTYIN